MSKNIMLFLSSAILTVGCSNLKKQTDSTSAGSSATASVAQAPKTIQAPAPDTTAKAPEQSMTCKRGSEIRTMQIEDVQPKGCKLQYARYGKTDAIASSVKGPDHCKEVKTRIQKKLEATGFKCTEGAVSEAEAKPVATVTPAAPATKPAPAHPAPSPAATSAPGSRAPAPVATPAPAKSSTSTTSSSTTTTQPAKK